MQRNYDQQQEEYDTAQRHLERLRKDNSLLSETNRAFEQQIALLEEEKIRHMQEMAQLQEEKANLIKEMSTIGWNYEKNVAMCS